MTGTIQISLTHIMASAPCATGVAKALYLRDKITKAQLERTLETEDVADCNCESDDSFDDLFPLTDVLDACQTQYGADLMDDGALDDVLWCMRCLPEHNYLWRKFNLWTIKKRLHKLPSSYDTTAFDTICRYFEGNATIEELEQATASAHAQYNAWVSTAPVYNPEIQDTMHDIWKSADMQSDLLEMATPHLPNSEKAEKLRQILTAGHWID